MPPTAIDGAATATSPTSLIGVLGVVAIAFMGAVRVVYDWLLRRLARRPQYVELAHKMSQEVATVGLVYLLVKLVVAVASSSSTQSSLRDAFDSADLLLFVAIISMVAQAVVVIVVLHSATNEMDGLGLMWSFEVVDEIQAAKSRRSWCLVRNWYASRVQLKLVGAYFRHVYELPPLFGFAKYVRGVQEHLTSQLFDVGFGASIVWLVYFYTFFALTEELDAPFVLERGQNLSMQALSRWSVFVWFSCVVFGLATALYVLLAWSYSRLVHHAKLHALVGSSPTSSGADSSIWDAIASLATKECTVAQLGPAEALVRMDGVGERLGSKITVSMPRPLWLWWQPTPSTSSSLLTDIDRVSLPLPNYRICRVALQVLLQLNGVSYAFFATAVLPAVVRRPPSDAFLMALAALAPLLAVSIVLAPRLIRTLALVHSTWHVDGAKLSRVIADVVHVEHVKSAMVADVAAHCRLHRQTTHDMRSALVPTSRTTDSDKSKGGASASTEECFVDIDLLRRVIKQFGHRMTCHDVTAIVRAMDIRTSGTCVCVDEVLAIFDAQRHPVSIATAEPDSSNLRLLKAVSSIN